MKNVINGKLSILEEKKHKQYRLPFGTRIYMSHPENKRPSYYQEYLKSNIAIPVKETCSTSLPNLDKTDSTNKGADSYTQTSKTILQLAELESGYLSPDSLTSSPNKQTVKKKNQFTNPYLSCSENFDMSVPYIRKRCVQDYLYECYDTKKTPREETCNSYQNASLTNTFLAKKHNEGTNLTYGYRSRFLQQTSPLRNLTSCSPTSSFKSQSYFEPKTSSCHKAKKNVFPVSRFTVKKLRNQEVVHDMPSLISWSKSEQIDEKVNESGKSKNVKKLSVNKRGTSFMSPTIASEQRNQQHLVKSFDRSMSPTKRGRSLSPNRMLLKDKILYPNNTGSQVSSNCGKLSNHEHYNGAKSSSVLYEYDPNDSQLRIDLSGLNVNSPHIEPSLTSTTTSVENSIFQIMTRVKDSQWSIALKGLIEVTECSQAMDTSLLFPHMTTINQKLLQLLRSPRSHVCRTACQIAGHLFAIMKDTRRPEFDDIVEVLLSKTADSNKCIRKDANLSLDCMVTHIPIYHAIRSLCLKGPSHKNPLVRTATLRLIVCAVVITGSDIILGSPGHEATRKRIIIFFPQFLFDKHLETRKYGERLFKIFSKEPHFEYYLKKYLDPNDINRISIILKSKDVKR